MEMDNFNALQITSNKIDAVKKRMPAKKNGGKAVTAILLKT